ncbi:transglutaminaseTgpA domain-containing protein [Microbacterium sp. gxy059]|uniref:transglutaminase family protein n=1 Tax=Microbacterium sp. gxy059 TaxID=2957199 RepID=UPI003D9647EB
MTGARRRPSRGERAALAAMTLAAVASSLLPLIRPFGSSWIPAAATLAVAVIGAGLVVRMTRLPGAVAVLAQLAVWIAGGLVALPGSIGRATPGRVHEIVAQSAHEIVTGVIPVDPSPALAFLLIVAVGALALLADLLVAALRAPLAAAALLLAVFALPQIAVPQGDDLALALVHVPLLLALLLVSSRVRVPRARRGRGALGVGAALAVCAIVAGLAVAPEVALRPLAFDGSGPRSTRIDAALDLGDDLRDASGTEVLRVRTDAARAPYLRVATVTTFDGEAWVPDEPASDGPAETLPPIRLPDGTVREETAVVDVVGLDDPRLPLPAHPVAQSGMRPGWVADPRAATVTAGGPSSLGEQYEVSFRSAEPSAAEARAIAADPPRDARLLGELAAEARRIDAPLPPALEAVPRDLGLDASRPYDSLVTLQDWLRSGEFSYSLTAPVEEGFDGSGFDALERFLEVREGYCVHFAATFSLVSRALGVPTRIVVGYLPGEATGRSVGGLREYAVDSGRLHAWPEAFLGDLGWVAFEPTPGLAPARGAAPDDTERPAPEPEETTDPSPTAEPEESEVPDPAERPDQDPDAGAPGGPDASGDPLAALRAVGVALGALALLAAPAIVRAVIGAARRRAARAGDAGAAWRELRAIAQDARLPVTAADSPRAVGGRITAAGGDPQATEAVVGAVERAAFARGETTETGLDAPLRRISRSLRPAAPGRRLARAALPRSLWTRARLGGPPRSG